MKRRKHVTHRKQVTRTKARACDGKVPYPTRERAESRRRQYIDAGTAPGQVLVYQCPHSDPPHYHVGHTGAGRGRSW